jgi:hypothetical protein
VKTVDGGERTVTIVPPALTGASNGDSMANSSDNDSNSGSGVKLPTLLGIVFGCIGGIVVFVAGVVVFVMRKKQNENDDAYDNADSPPWPETSSKNSIGTLSDPFSDQDPRITPFAQGLYSLRNGSGSIEFLPDQDGRLRVVNPDPETSEKS